MNQQQTNTLLIFLAITIVQFAGYPILMGGFRQSGDPLAAIIIILMSGLFTCVYYLISNPTKIPINWSDIQHRFQVSVVQAIILILFLTLFLIGSTIVLISWAGVDRIKDVGIGIIGGIISGALILFIQRSLFYGN